MEIPVNTLIAIKSCHLHREYHDQIRATWLKDSPIEARFFIGNPHAVGAPDEVFVAAPDGAGRELYLKALEIIVWALTRGYDFLFICDTDTYVHIPRLLSSGFETHDYSGHVDGDNVYGGTGFWLSYQAMDMILRTWKQRVGTVSEDLKRAQESDDWWVYYMLKLSGIAPFHDARYAMGPLTGPTMVGPQPDNDIITCHKHWHNPEGRLRCEKNLYAIHEKTKGI